MVTWLGALQAQDYAGAKWSVGLRLPGAIDAGIEEALAGKSVVRSWSLRGTLHMMAPADIRWMLELAAPRLLNTMGTHFRKLELDKPVLAKSKIIIEKALRDGKHLTRKELMNAMEWSGVSTKGLRSNFFMVFAALEQLICCGVRRNKEFTYTLLDEWIPTAKRMQRDEALAALAIRYFTSHGPATLQDFVWWSGLTVAEAKKGRNMAGSCLLEEISGGKTYIMAQDGIPAARSSGIYLLPGFDEYMLGYKDRSNILDMEYVKQVVGTGNGLFSATIVINGRVAGTWKRSFGKGGVMVDVHPFTQMSKSQSKALEREAGRYAGFMDMPLIQR